MLPIRLDVGLKVASQRHSIEFSHSLGTIWDIGEAAGPIIAGFLIAGLGFASTFDTLALAIVAVSIGVVLLLKDPKIGVAADRRARSR